MNSDIGNWEKLEKIHGRILHLERKRRRMYSERSRQIADRASITEYLEGQEVFGAQVRSIETELYGLWAQKREELTRLRSSYAWSFAGPRIDVSAS